MVEEGGTGRTKQNHTLSGPQSSTPSPRQLALRKEQPHCTDSDTNTLQRSAMCPCHLGDCVSQNQHSVQGSPSLSLELVPNPRLLYFPLHHFLEECKGYGVGREFHPPSHPPHWASRPLGRLTASHPPGIPKSTVTPDTPWLLCDWARVCVR